MPLLPQTPLARRRRLRALALFSVLVLGVTYLATRGGGKSSTKASASSPSSDPGGSHGGPGASSTTPLPASGHGLATPETYLPGVPANHDPNNLYYYDGANLLAPQVAADPPRIYVPNTGSNSVSVIDPTTYKVIQTIPVGVQPQHVSPSFDLKTLWVENDRGNSLTPINPATGAVGAPVPVDDPYNLYFTPDGTRAAVMAEALRRMDFRDGHTMALEHSMPVPCNGLNHMDFSPDGRTAVASCEFDGQLLQIDMTPGRERVLQAIKVGGMPQDVKLAPDASVYYVADMNKDGVHVIDATAFKEIEFIKTGKGAHGLYPSRDASQLYVSNRGEGSVSVLDFATRQLVAKWTFNGGRGSPDMGGVSADGKILWLSGRYDSEMYAISTQTGQLVVPPIKVGSGPHGACVWPQPGRYSMGHTGIFR
jgi:YVTN family beta-propeller protein